MEGMSAVEKQNAQAIQDLKRKDFGMVRKVAKEQWIKTSFWMPENAEEESKNGASTGAERAQADDARQEAKPMMMCPFNRVRHGEGSNSDASA